MPRGVLTALGVMLLLQTLIAFSAHSPAVFAPVVTRDLGLAPERVGLFIVIAYLVAMFAGLACNNFIARYGPLRVVQVCIASAGLGLMIGGVGMILSVVVGALVIGFGQGMTGPASTVILAARSPRNRIALILSIKQSGVPIGAAIAGAIVPGLILAVGWQVTVGAIGAGFILIAIALQPMRASYDRARNPNVRISVAGSIIQMKESVALAWANRRDRKSVV